MFKDNTPLVIGGFEDGEGPGEANNVTVTGCTFLHSQGLTIAQNGGTDTAVTGSNTAISNNQVHQLRALRQHGLAPPDCH